MSATLDILCSFSVTINGVTYTGKQGTSTDGTDDVFSVTVDGKSHGLASQLATATVVTLWDDDTNSPIDFDYLFFWCDQDVTFQVVGSGSQYAIKQLAKVPIIMTYDSMLAAANTTDITTTEPSFTDIDHVNAGNYSGTTANYVFFVVD